MSSTIGTLSRFWFGGNGAHFTPDQDGKGDYIHVQEAGVVAPGMKLKMSISWQKRENFDLKPERLSQELTLTVNILGQDKKILKTYTAAKKNRGFQELEFKIPKGGETFEYWIRRVKNCGGSVNLGYSLQVLSVA